jgi:hypothetical protein
MERKSTKKMLMDKENLDALNEENKRLLEKQFIKNISKKVKSIKKINKFICEKCGKELYSLEEVGNHAVGENHYTFNSPDIEGKLCLA